MCNHEHRALTIASLKSIVHVSPVVLIMRRTIIADSVQGALHIEITSSMCCIRSRLSTVDYQIVVKSALSRHLRLICE